MTPHPKNTVCKCGQPVETHAMCRACYTTYMREYQKKYRLKIRSNQITERPEPHKPAPIPGRIKTVRACTPWEENRPKHSADWQVGTYQLVHDPSGDYRPGAMFRKQDLPNGDNWYNSEVSPLSFEVGTIFEDTRTGKRYEYDGKRLEVR